MSFKTQEYLNKIYRDYMARLGELEIMKHKIEEEMQQIRTRSSVLDTLVKPLQDIELSYIKNGTDNE